MIRKSGNRFSGSCPFKKLERYRYSTWLDNALGHHRTEQLARAIGDGRHAERAAKAGCGIGGEAHARLVAQGVEGQDPRLLDYLEEGQREVVLLRFFEELSLKEVADAVGKSVGATAMLLTRAKANLKEWLGEMPEL